MTPDSPPIRFDTRQDWWDWLDRNHGDSAGVWIRFAKKGSSLRSMTYAEALECALCFGWIDGQTKSEGAETYVQRFTPRRKQSVWSKINRGKALALIESGQMQPAGLAEVERARADGRWDSAYDAWSTATVPDDLRAALEKNRRAREFFNKLDSRNRYAILHRVQTARKAETRAQRIARFVDMLAWGETLHS